MGKPLQKLFPTKSFNVLVSKELAIESRLAKAVEHLAHLKSLEYRVELVGTLGRQPIH